MCITTEPQPINTAVKTDTSEVVVQEQQFCSWISECEDEVQRSLPHCNLVPRSCNWHGACDKMWVETGN